MEEHRGARHTSGEKQSGDLVLVLVGEQLVEVPGDGVGEGVTTRAGCCLVDEGLEASDDGGSTEGVQVVDETLAQRDVGSRFRIGERGALDEYRIV